MPLCLESIFNFVSTYINLMNAISALFLCD